MTQPEVALEVMPIQLDEEDVVRSTTGWYKDWDLNLFPFSDSQFKPLCSNSNIKPC